MTLHSVPGGIRPTSIPAPACVFLTLCLVACRERDAVVIGVATGPARPNVVDIAQRVLDSTQRGGPRIHLVTDSATGGRGDLTDAVAIAGRMVALPNIAAVVGHSGSRDALIAAPIYSENGMPQVVPTATSRELARVGPWTFMLAPDDSVEGEFIARYAVERLGARSVTIYFVTDEYGTGVRTGVSRAFRERGVTILDEVPIPFDTGCSPEARQRSYEDAVSASLRRGIPDLVILATRSGESSCIMLELGLRRAGVRFLAGDGTLASASFLAQVGSGADSLYMVAFWHHDLPDSSSQRFAGRFRNTFGREPAHSDAMTYDAIMVLASAIREVGSDRGAIQEYLRSLGRSRPAYQGVTGPISFPARPDGMLVTRVEAGRTILADRPR